MTQRSCSADKRVTVGSRWSDNYDPERFPRVVEIVRVVGERVIIKTVHMSGNPGYARHTETDIARFGKPGRSGFTFVCDGREGEAFEDELQ